MSSSLPQENPQDSGGKAWVRRHNARLEKFKPSRTLLYLRNRANPINVTASCLFLMVMVLSGHRLLSFYMMNRTWMNAPIMDIHRKCPAPKYQTWASEPNRELMQQKVGRICITTLTDHKSTSRFQRFIRWRNYDGILDMTWKNKQDYADKHGYGVYDGSDLIDTSRPPAWTKVIAIQRLLEAEDCNWVMWTDADTVIMNSDIRIESFLPTDDKHDLLAAEDDISGYNSGVLLFRNTPWSKQLLQDWWNMKSYVRPPGFSLSGDNYALKALLRDMKDFDDHVLVPPRCTFNSFAMFLSIRGSKKILKKLQDQEWYMSDMFYHKGDFIAHTPGYDNKAETLGLLLQDAH